MEKVLLHEFSSAGLSIFVTIAILFVHYKVLQTRFEEVIKKMEEKLKRMELLYSELQQEIHRITQKQNSIELALAKDYRNKNECLFLSNSLKDSFAKEIKEVKKELCDIKKLLLEMIKRNNAV